MEEFVGFDGAEGCFKSQALVDEEPLAGLAVVPLDVKAVPAHPVEAGKGGSNSSLRLSGKPER